MTPTDSLIDDEVAALVSAAAAGSRPAWDELVDRYVGLLWSIARGFRLSESDAADVVQTTWLRLLEHIDGVHDGARVGAWLATTARRECLRALAYRNRVVLGDDALLEQAVEQEDVAAALLRRERSDELSRAIESLPRRWRQVMDMLLADPSPSYDEISQRLGIPIGSIGPTRGRCVARLRVALVE